MAAASGVAPRAAQNPDDPLPSIESEPRRPAINSSHGSSTPEARTPSLSVLSSPPYVGETLGTPSQRTRSERRAGSVDGIASRLRDVNLNTHGRAGLAMSGVAAALSDAANGLDHHAAQLEPSREAPSLSPDRQQSRRRSSQRVDLIPHNVQDEDPPEDRFHSPDVQQAFSGAKNLMERLTAVLSSSSLHHEPDSTMRRLHQRCGDLGRFRCPPTRTVGFVGDSGVGKCTGRILPVRADRTVLNVFAFQGRAAS